MEIGHLFGHKLPFVAKDIMYCHEQLDPEINFHYKLVLYPTKANFVAIDFIFSGDGTKCCEKFGTIGHKYFILPRKYLS